MADVKKNQSKVYNALKGMGFSGIGANEEEFAAKMGNPKNREKVYQALTSKGYKGIGKDQAAFDSLIYQASEAPAPSVAQPQTTNEPLSPYLTGQQVSESTMAQNFESRPGFKSTFDPNAVTEPKQKDQPAVATQPQQTVEQPKQTKQQGLTWQERMAMGMNIGSVQNTAQNATKGVYEISNAAKQASPFGGTAGIGNNSNLRKGDKTFDAEKGAFVDTYLTSDGRKFNDVQQANNVQANIDYNNDIRRFDETMKSLGIDVEADKDKDINRLLGDAYKELHDLEAQEREIAKRETASRKTPRFPSMVGGPVETYTMSDESKNISSAKRLLQRRIDALETVRDNGGFWGGTGDVLTDPSSYSFGLTDLADASVMQNLSKKIADAREKGISPQLTDSEKALARNYMLNQQAQAKVADNDWYQIGRGFGQTLSFMKDFALTGGGFMNIARGGMALGAKGGAKLAAATLGDYMTKNLGTRALGKLIVAGGKGVGLVAGAEAGGLALNNTIQAASNLADITEKYTGNLAVGKDGNLSFENSKSLGEAVLKSQLSRGGENASELVGLAFDAVPGILGKVIQRTKIGQLATKVANSKFWKGSEKALNYLGVQSVWGEGMEEEYNMARDVLIGESNWFKDPNDPNKPAFFDGEQQLKTWEQVGITSMLLRVPAMIATGTQQANYYANMYNLNSSDRQMRDVFGADGYSRYENVKAMMDGADNAQLAGVLNNLMNNAELSNEEKQAMFMYANDLVKLRGFNIGNVVAAAEGFQAPPRVSAYNIKGNTVEEVDEQDNVIETHEYENRDAMKAGLYEMQQARFDKELSSDVGVMKSRPNDQFDALVQEYLLQSNAEILPTEFEVILDKPSMERTEEEQALVLPFAELLHNTVYDNTMIHEERSMQDGEEVADMMVIGLDEADPTPAADIMAKWQEAQANRQAVFEANEDLKQEVTRMESEGLSHQEIISALDWARPDELNAIIDYYNQKASFEGYMNRMGQNIAEEAANSRERHTLNGTINGVADVKNVHTITDGTNEYYLVSGNITTDSDGRITGSDSGLIIGMDLDGSFVNISDSDGYSVMPVTETLDQWEEAERTRLEEEWSAKIDPTGAMMQQPTEVQGGNQDNAEGEAGASTGTRANEPSAAAPVAPTQPVNPPAPAGGAAQPRQQAVAIESVTDKDGIKRYEQGIAVDDAIADIIADGFDVNEIADASIAEAQATVDKINGKATKTRKDLMDKKKAQDVITYYNNVKARWSEVNAEEMPQPTENPANSEENVNVEPEQPTIAEKPVSSQSNLTVEEQKQQRIAEAKAKYGELFDDDFTKANDVNELVSMWVGRKRNLAWDDVNGKRGLQKELGWTRKIGGDTKYIETLLAKKGEGVGVDEFVHMVWESPENDIMGEKRFSTEEIKEALLDLLKSAQSKSDVVDYALNTRIAQAETAMQEQQKQAEAETEQQAEIEPLTAEQIADMEASMPFAQSTDEEIEDHPLNQLRREVEALMQEEGMPPIQLVDTERMNDGDWIDLANELMGYFLSQEEVDYIRQQAMEQGVIYFEQTGNIVVFSGAITPDALREKFEQLKEISNEEVEQGTDGISDEQGGNTDLGAVQTENAQGYNGESQSPATNTGSESQGSSESVGDAYLQPRNAEEEKIIANVIAQLQQEIGEAIDEQNKARSELEKAMARESERATDMFGNDNALNQPGQLFDNSDMPIDQSVEGVERRTSAEREKLQEATNKLNRLQSIEERNSRIRGALDNYRRQTKIETEEHPTAYQPKWQYQFHYNKETGRAWITRDDVSGPIPLQDGRFYIEGKSLAELRGILENPANNLGELLKEVETQLHNAEALEKWRRENDPMEAIEHTAQEFRQEQEEKKAYGADNKLVSKDRYEELKKRMRDKLLGQMNLGVDPEILSIGTEMAVYHIEAGARKFMDYATNMINDLGDAIRPYLKAFYEGARRLPEMSELSKEMDSVSDVDAFDVLNYDKQPNNTVNEHKQENNEPENSVSLQQEAQERVSEAVPQPTRKAEDADKYRAFSQAVADDMLEAMKTGEKPYKSIKDIRAKAKSVGLEVDDDGRTDILLQELVEDGLVSAARQYVNLYMVNEMLAGRKADEIRNSRALFEDIVKLYYLQPSITQRSSNRIKMQQYSTPLPMSFIADVFAFREGMQDVLEPTAGNGMMVFAVPEFTVHANELDDTRLDNLRAQKFKKVTDQDATQPFEGEQYDAIIANPPFGAAPAKDYDGKMISGLDEQIALNALSKMKDDGKAAIIIGGNMEYAPNGAIKSDKAFFTYLYDHYNVKGVIDMDGKLFSKQGTTYPTRMILIDGRRSEEERAQSKVYPPTLEKRIGYKVDSFAELYDLAEEIKNNNRKTDGNEILRTSTGIALPDNNDASGNTDRSGRDGQSRQNESNGERSESRGSNSGSQTATREGTSQRGRRGSVGVQQPGIPGLFDSQETASETQPQTGGSREGGSVSDNGRNGSADVQGSRTTNSGVGLNAGAKPQPTEQATPKVAVAQQQTQPVKPKVEEKRELDTDKLSYRPHNTAFSLESVAPAAMVEAMDKMLTKIEKEHGNIDEWVTKELGYDSIEDMHNALAAEQVDSVAMAIYQMKHGQGMIIGDQTGVGKGRQMAALIRWACRQGKKPVFITQKADLFSDIYRDLVDIGSGELRPFIFNSDGAMVDNNGVVVHKPLPASTQAKVFAGHELPTGYDFAVLTYSQVNTGDQISQDEAKEAAKKSGERYQKKKKKDDKPKATPKATFLRALAKDNYMFLDESHTAAGKSNTGFYFQSILKTAKAVTFASATFAKRPDTMPMYALRTAMSKAKVKAEELIKIIENGGVTLQEIMSRALTQAGQMVRRERDMSDVKTDWKTVDDPETVKKARQNYDSTIEAFNAIIDFQKNWVSGYLDRLSKDLADVAASAGMRQGTEDLGISNVPFASKTYNYTKQLMLALKVDAIVDEVVKEIEAGRHPVIALENTMGSLLSEYSPGDVIEDTTFAASLLKGLKGVLRYTIKDEDGKEQQAELKPSDLGPEGEAAYHAVEDLIRESTSGIFISPLDAITQKLQAKGYKVGELTGRNEMAVLDEKTGEYKVQRRTDKDKKKLARDFNSGALDVLILNKSASTGISLHASEKFSDQRQRTMIIAQPLADINDYMQMIGRIDRTGQVARGYYINLGLPVPAEGRFLMMLSTKLKSLNANTTTSQENESNDVEAPDLLNKYGSRVVIEYLRDNPDVYVKMGEPLRGQGAGAGRVSVGELDTYIPQEDDARKITGYVALLPTAEQDAFYNDVVRRYTELIKYLNDTGSNDLKISVLPLRARTIEKQISSEGADPTGDNPFAGHAYVEWVEMDVLKKPMKAAEVGKVIEQLNPEVEAPKVQAKTASQEKMLNQRMTPRVKQIYDTVEKEYQAKMDKEEARYAEAKTKAEEAIKEQTEKINNSKRTPEQKKEAIEKYKGDRIQALEETHNNMVNKIEASRERIEKPLRDFEVGDSYLVPDDLTTDTFFGASPAIFCGFKAKDEGITPSTTLAVFCTLDGRRKIEIKLSDWGPLARIKNHTEQNWDAAHEVTLSNWDSQVSNETRKHGFIMTGNILQAFADAGSDGRVPGQLVTYTDIDGNVHDGILMGQHWEPSQLKGSTVPIKNRMDEIKNLPNGEHVTSADGNVVIERLYSIYTISVPKSKKVGGQYYEDRRLLNLVRGQDFYPNRGQLRADIEPENIEEVVNVLSDLGVQMKSDTQVQFDTETEMGQANASGRRFDEDIDEDELYSISGTDYQIGEYGEWNDELEQSEAPVFKNGKRVATIINGGAEFGFLAISTEQEGYATEDFYETEADALEALERLMETGDEHTSTEKVADGYYTVEEAQAKVDKLSAKYPPITHVGVTHSKCNDKELFGALFGKNVAELMLAMGGPKVQSAIDQIRKILGAAGNFDGGFVHILDKIIIFADRISKDNFEDSYFHENIHAFLNKKYGDIAKDGTLPLRDIAERFWNNTPEQVGRTSKEFVRRVYEKSPKAWPEEFFTYCVGRAMADGRFDIIDKYIKDEADRKELEEILNALNYDRTRESESRAGESGANGENKERRYSISDSRQVSKKKGKKVIEPKSRIANHIDNLVKKLGTKAKTTVYHSFNELPADMKRHIRERERQGKKVRGWYENGHIYLYLPHIDSVYQAEKTIWHETVAHHGLRELIGEDNLDKLLKQLWLTHKDGAMGEWVAERMQQNGWKLNEAIEEYLAREAEKNPFKEPGLWQRLRWMLAEVLHKMGFATDPTIADVQYLFWQSQNQLTNNDPMGVIKQQAFLHHLEREAANTPYVNMNAERVEDIYNPEAEGAYPDGKTIRHSEETDEEVIERLEKEPKVKVYRAMQLIDGKLYPPMAAKQNGKLVNPIELGKWEKADEHPEMADENGKFKLDKGNGKSLKAAYNPYIHTSTTMLNDQFSEAQNRPNLVVVEVEVPESELASGYKAEKAKDSVGKMDWKAGIIQGQLSGTREVILSRWDKPVRIVPNEEVAQHIADMIKGKVDVMPTNVVTPQQRAELEKLGVKFVETDNRGFIKEGENAGKSYSSVYSRQKTNGHGGRRFDEDIESPLEYSAKKVYDDRLNRVETVFSEAYQDAMVSLKTAQNAIAQDKDIPDSQNAYMAENLMHGKNKNEQDLYNKMFRDPLIATINKIMNLTGMNWGDVDRYVYTKSGLERNREFFVRDWMEAELNKTIHSYEDLNDAEQDIYDRMANGITTKFEDGDIDESERDKKLRQALQEAHIRYVRNVEYDWQMLKLEKYQDLKDGLITFPEYLEEVDRFIRYNIDDRFKAEEHDYSGFRAMFGDEEGNYSEAEIIDELMNTEDAINSIDDIATNSTVDTLWEQINSATKYGLERYREAGMRSDEQIDRVEGMFHWYVPMRGFKEETGEDMYQYFTGKGREKSYLGGLLKHAKGRGSEAQYPISTIFAMSYKAISDCNQNLVNQKLYRLCQANPNDLVILSDSWAAFNDITGEWEETAPEIPEDASEEEVREITLAWEDNMRQLALENKAKKIRGKVEFDYKPMDKKKQSEHIVDVRINGQPKKMIVTGNPRMAQALNGQLRFEHGRNVFSKWNAAIKNFMASLFTSYSPTFALRNMFRDWTHFRMMLGVREGHGYASQANKYYRQSLFKMVGLFKKYREGKLDESKEMERDFKDFMDEGGITGFVFMQKIDDIQKEMEKLYKQQKQGKTIRLNNKIWEYTLGAIEAVNEGIENNARFATYRASRHYAGRTKARSAYDAKEITVNFNRKGAGGKTAGFKSREGVMPKKVIEDAAKAFGVSSQILGEGRIFFNATVQAIATTFKNFQNADGSLNGKYIAKWAAKYAIPPFMFGLLLPAINKALANAFGGGDDDDPYANLAEWTRRRNICIYIGNDNFLTIPIGQELAAFLALGDIMAGNTYAPDLKPVDRDFGDEMVGVMNTFSPVDISTKITKGGLMEDPISEVTGRTFSVLAPLVAVEQNLGWTGRPIYREDKFQNDQYTPEYQMVYQSTNPVLVNASKLLHELGGGDDITRGKLEVNPAIIQYLWEQYTGGPGKVFSNTISIGKDAKDILSGNESDFNIRKVEGLKAFVSQGDDRTQYYRTQAKYRKYSEDAKKLYHDVKGYENAATTDPTALMKLEKISRSEDFVRMQIIREADKQLSQINKAANKAEGKERKELRRLYNEQVKAVVDMLDEVGKE